MMGTKTLKEIRQELAKILGKNETEVRKWLDRQMAKLRNGPLPDPRATESLIWIRDALEEAVKQKKPRKKPRASGKRKSAPAA
jgi:hypothetical protein